MKEIVLDGRELLWLMDRLQLDRPIGVEPDLLPQPTSDERPAMIQGGYEALKSRGLITFQDEVVVVDDTLRQMMQTILRPEAVVGAYRETADGEKLWSWHYVSDESIVALSLARLGEYRFAFVPDLMAVLEHLRNTMPLEPEPETVHYEANVPQEDATEISWMAAQWDMVPALEILTAGGLEPVEAMDLFDDIADFKWRGRVDLMACKDGRIVEGHRVLAIQGQERSWVARQDKPGASTIHIHTAMPGDFEHLLGRYWAEIGS
jgi:hypothetical protein